MLAAVSLNENKYEANHNSGTVITFESLNEFLEEIKNTEIQKVEPRGYQFKADGKTLDIPNLAYIQ
ncbi:MAG: hypothetical protein H7281_01230 [Bacteriovorax sp.]|nr:hypothetical protein [Bacteriovorax sp.]